MGKELKSQVEREGCRREGVAARNVGVDGRGREEKMTRWPGFAGPGLINIVLPVAT